ncbi:Fur family transcriptional regulator [Agromyces sp. Root81]|uniref:Fur family transcriptional regulator n=1 Tax=Agromyces sp. Root81 TaxID=1736601 RepID=UPI0006FD0934|nr:Fur family transcriptional regulator [Agromyces sp. Root81]KRC61251.1 Fur family transcriptional regulator [Agromyces sp. Root81]
MTSNATDERERAAARLRGAGLKVTESRLAVFDAFHAGEHLDADDVHTRVAELLPTTSRQAVYGVLGALTDAGLLRRIEPAGSPALYETRTGDNHHHLVCTSCGKVFDVGCVVGEAACLTPSETHGFRIATAEVTFWGLCPECSASGALS